MRQEAVRELAQADSRARWLLPVLALQFFWNVVMLALAASVLAGMSHDQAVFTWSDGVSGCLRIATLILFLRWWYQAYANLKWFGVQPRFSPGMAVVHWFIPFANFVLPYLTAKEMWRTAWRQAQPAHEQRAGLSSLRLWWALWLAPWIMPLGVAIGWEASQLAESTDDVMTRFISYGWMIGSAINVVFYPMTIRIVHFISTNMAPESLGYPNGTATPQLGMAPSASDVN